MLFSANFNYTLGRVVEDGSQRPLDHIAPYFGKVGLLYTYNKLNLEGYMLYNGKRILKSIQQMAKITLNMRQQMECQLGKPIILN